MLHQTPATIFDAAGVWPFKGTSPMNVCLIRAKWLQPDARRRNATVIPATALLIIFIATALLAGSVSAGSGIDDLKPYPAPEAGMQRIVIRVPDVPNADDLKVEVMIGRTVEIDCNRHTFSSSVTRKVAEGWGFPYYVVGEIKGLASTLMACAPEDVTHREFVGADAGELAWLPYTPRLPIVIYVPTGTEIRYRIWHAGNVIEDAQTQ